MNIHSKLVLMNCVVLPVFVLMQVNICPELVLLQTELVVLHGVLPELVLVHRVVPELVLVDIFVIIHVYSTNLVQLRLSFSELTTRSQYLST